MSGFVDMVSSMCALSGVSGSEQEVRDFIRERVMAFADRMEEDALGNLLIFRTGRRSCNKPRMLCAHMDEVGLLVRGVTDEGLLRIMPVGGVSPGAVMGRRVLVGPDKRPGVVCVTPRHLLTGREKKMFPDISELFVDIGASGREQAASWAEPGDACAFAGRPKMLGPRFLAAKAIDDRLGCAMLMRLILEEEPIEDTWFVFTAQEELGGRGAHGAAHFVDPSCAVVLEVTTAADLPSLPEHKRVCRLGGGVVIPTADRGAVYEGALRQKLIDLAEKRGLRWQDKEALLGGTDAGVIHTRLNGIPCAALSAPARCLHGPVSVADTTDFEPMYELLRAWMTEA